MATTPRSTGTASGHGTVRPGVFICYRHEDSPGQALRVYRLLSSTFGEDRVFMDLAIPGGVDFPEWIERSVGAAGVVTPIIGRSWLERDAGGVRRLDDERDFVRGEIVGALERGIHVLPVLVDDAEMPSEEELPASLARLPYLNAHVLRSDVYWRESEARLVARVGELLGEDPLERPVERVAPPPERLPASVTAAGLVGASLLVIGLVLLWNTYITPGFPYLPIAPGVFTAWAPLAILAGALVALARVRGSDDEAWLDVGLLAGFGFEAAVKGLSVLGESDARGQVGGLLWLLGGAGLGFAAVIAANHYRSHRPAEAQREAPQHSTAVVAVLGAVLLVVGTAIAFNVAKPGGSRTVMSDGHSIETIGTALAALGAVAVLLAGRRALAAGLLIALGLGSALLWVRYTGIPVAQWLHTSGRHASPRAGGFVGLAGGLLILAAGWRLAVSSPAAAPAAEPLPTT